MSKIPCPVCHGAGEVVIQHYSNPEGDEPVRCDECDETGVVEVES